MKFVKQLFLLIFAVGVTVVLLTDYRQRIRTGEELNIGNTYTFDRDRFAGHEPVRYRIPGSDNDTIVYGIGSVPVNEISTVVFKVYSYSDEESEGTGEFISGNLGEYSTSTHWLRRTPCGNFDVRKQSDSGVMILNHALKQIWQKEFIITKETYGGAEFDEAYGKCYKPRYEFYSYILARWGGENEIVERRDMKGEDMDFIPNIRVIHDIRINEELPDYLFLPQEEGKPNYVEAATRHIYNTAKVIMEHGEHYWQRLIEFARNQQHRNPF
jgi:hypothetical protein